MTLQTTHTVPGLYFLNVATPEHIYRLFVKCDYMNQPLSMANMSTGTKRVIWLLANAVY